MKGMTLARTDSHHISIAIMQALVVSMQVALGTDIRRPEFRHFGDCWSGILCERVKRRQAVHEGEGSDCASIS